MAGLLTDKAVLVTGAAGGIGRQAALIFANEGARVAVADINEAGASETAEMIRSGGGVAIALTADLTKAVEVNAMVRSAVDALGPLAGAFNNAGISGGSVGQGGRFSADWDEEAFDRVVSVNLKGTWLCMREEIHHMMAHGGGAIVNTASLAGVAGFVTTSGYTASKHAIVGMTKTAAMEYAPKIRVNALCPGYVDTELLRDAMSRRGEQILSRIPFRRLANPAEIAQMACWLLSDRASYATGQAFTVDGGFLAG